MIELEEGVKAKIALHAEEAAPRECCGVITIIKGRQVYVPCRNMAETVEDFLLHPEDFADAQDKGEVVAIVHSHPTTKPEPSAADLASMEESGLPWFIYNPFLQEWGSAEPTGIKPALYGRKFVHGVFDCYGFVRDYYRQELHIDLPYFHRNPEWWAKGEELLLDNNLIEAGFVEVDQDKMRVNDVLVMQINSVTPNHVGILVEDNILGHHAMNRLSSKDVYGQLWRNYTRKVIRHRSLL